MTKKMSATQHAIVLQIYTALELLNADPYLLAIVGSWGDTMNDDETLEALKHWNAGTFKMEMITSTGKVAKIRAAQALRKPPKPPRGH